MNKGDPWKVENLNLVVFDFCLWYIWNMATVTIPKKLTKGEELVVIPRKDYEDFLRYRLKENEELTLTSSQKRRLQKARGNLANGKYLTIYELKSKLGIKN